MVGYGDEPQWNAFMTDRGVRFVLCIYATGYFAARTG